MLGTIRQQNGILSLGSTEDARLNTSASSAQPFELLKIIPSSLSKTESNPNEETSNLLDNTTEQSPENDATSSDTPVSNEENTPSNEGDASIEIQTQDQGSFDGQSQTEDISIEQPSN